MNLLLDQGLPRLAVPELRRFGFDVVHAGDVGMAAATDDELLLFARREGRVIVTLDADFHAALALSNAATPPPSSVCASRGCALSRSQLFCRRS